jgi:glycosyltransferase involved in cell wall biosynthesis
MAVHLDTPQLPKELSPVTRQALPDQITWVGARARERKGLVYFPPSIGWEIVAFQRPHHLARAFATRGFAVVFDSRNSHDRVFGFREIEPDIFLFKGPPELLRALPVTLVWAFVYNFPYRLEVTPNAPLVYDIIDALEVFPYERAELDRYHTWGLHYADFVTCVSRLLQEDVRAVRPDALYLPNAVEAWRFDTQGVAMPGDPALEGLLEARCPVAGYYGSFARWFDYDLVDEVARRLPRWRFLLIGPRLDQSGADHPLWHRANVSYLGPRDYAALPFYVDLFTVGLIPFRGESIGRGLSPLKLYEYMAAGKPVVTTPIPECAAFPEVTIARTSEEFAAGLDAAREQGRDQRFVARLREIGCANLWTDRVETISALVSRRS